MNKYDADSQTKRIHNAFSPLNNSVTPPLEISPFMIERELGKMPKPKRKMSRARLAALNIALAAVLCVSIVGFGLLNIRDSNSMMGGAHDVKEQNNTEQTAIGTAAKTNVTSAATAAVTQKAVADKNTVQPETESSLIKKLNSDALVRDARYPLVKGEADGTMTQGTKGESSYSKTNVQEEGVNEGDTVITDGEYIYKLRTETVENKKNDVDYILNYVEIINAKTMKKCAQIKEITSENFFVEMYLSDNLLTVLDYASRYAENETDKKSVVRIYDVSNKTSPKLRSKYAISGTLESSRMVNGVLYFITCDYVYVNETVTRDTLKNYLPTIETNGEITRCPVSNIYSMGNSGASFVNVCALKITDKSAKVNMKSVMCSLNDTYYSKSTAYLYSTDYIEDKIKGSYSYKTDFIKLNYSADKVSVACKFSADGHIDSRFSLSESGGYFRAVLTEETINSDDKSFEQASGVYVFDKNGKKVGSITGLGKNEDVYSVRFEGDICYFVTYETKDPLFAVDLSNPTKPKLISKLESPGYSTYLYRVKGYLVGVGNNDDGEPKISLFSKDGKTELDTVQLADTLKSIMKNKGADTKYGIYDEYELYNVYSPAVNDFHAFCANEKTGDILIPYYVSGEVGDELIEKTGLAVYTVDDGKLKVKKVLVSRNNDGKDLYDSRALYIGNYYYYIDDDCLIRYDSANDYAKVSLNF